MEIRVLEFLTIGGFATIPAASCEPGSQLRPARLHMSQHAGKSRHAGYCDAESHLDKPGPLLVNAHRKGLDLTKLGG